MTCPSLLRKAGQTAGWPLLYAELTSGQSGSNTPVLMCLPMDTLGKTRILIVEDEPDIAGLMKHALERGGDLGVEIVGTGAAALKSVLEEPPGLVLLDLNLPFIDGLEVCRLLARARVERSDSHHHGHGQDERNGARRRARTGRRRLRDQAVQPARTRRARARRVAAAAANRGAATSRLPARRAGDRFRRRLGARVRGQYQADQARVRAAALPRREPEPRALARPAARAGVGIRSPGRDAIGRRARRPSARQARARRPADRNGHRHGLPVRRRTELHWKIERLADWKI